MSNAFDIASRVIVLATCSHTAGELQGRHTGVTFCDIA